MPTSPVQRLSPCEPYANDPNDRAQMLPVNCGRPCRILRRRLRIGDEGSPGSSLASPTASKSLAWDPVSGVHGYLVYYGSESPGCLWILRLCTVGFHHNTLRDGDGLDPEYDLLFRGERIQWAGKSLLLRNYDRDGLRVAAVPPPSALQLR